MRAFDYICLCGCARGMHGGLKGTGACMATVHSVSVSDPGCKQFELSPVLTRRLAQTRLAAFAFWLRLEERNLKSALHRSTFFERQMSKSDAIDPALREMLETATHDFVVFSKARHDRALQALISDATGHHWFVLDKAGKSGAGLDNALQTILGKSKAVKNAARKARRDRRKLAAMSVPPEPPAAESEPA